MIKPEHTPGPWRIVQKIVEIEDPTFIGSGDPTAWATGIASEKELIVPHGFGLYQFNAHLIAAAPEMLEALEELMEEWTHYDEEGLLYEISQGSEFHETVLKARKIIKKAKWGSHD